MLHVYSLSYYCFLSLQALSRVGAVVKLKKLGKIYNESEFFEISHQLTVTNSLWKLSSCQDLPEITAEIRSRFAVASSLSPAAFLSPVFALLEIEQKLSRISIQKFITYLCMVKINVT